MGVIAGASLVEFFKGQVEAALADQGMPLSEATSHYVVRLLADTLRSDRSGTAQALLDPRPLALRLADAVDARCPAPGVALRGVADAALLLGGFFACRAGRRRVPRSYYHRLGGWAYGTLGQEPQRLAPVFKDLAARFAQYADVLSEVGQRAEIQTASGLVRALEAWERTHDLVTERLLLERGVVLSRGRSQVRLQ